MLSPFSLDPQAAATTTKSSRTSRSPGCSPSWNPSSPSTPATSARNTRTRAPTTCSQGRTLDRGRSVRPPRLQIPTTPPSPHPPFSTSFLPPPTQTPTSPTGEIYPSASGLYALGGTTTRTPGFYTRVSPLTGRPTRTPLRNTHEYIHASARTRTTLQGPGPNDTGLYGSRALEAYTLRVADPGTRGQGQGQPLAVWESKARRRGGGRKVLVESPLWEAERRLLGYSPMVEGAVLGEG